MAHRTPLLLPPPPPLQDNPDWEGVNTDLFVAATLEIAYDHAAHILPDADGTVHVAWQFGTE